VTDAVPTPALELADPKELLLGYLDYYRSVIARKLNGLTDAVSAYTFTCRSAYGFTCRSV
jgi:hypothetical protein